MMMMSTKRPGSEQSQQPPPKQSKSEAGDSGHTCIVCGENCDEKQKNLDDAKWKNFRLTAKKWSGLDTYGDVYEKTE